MIFKAGVFDNKIRPNVQFLLKMTQRDNSFVNPNYPNVQIYGKSDPNVLIFKNLNYPNVQIYSKSDPNVLKVGRIETGCFSTLPT